MKKILYLILAALVATAATAQTFKAEGGSFPIRYQLGSYDHLGYMRLHEPLATVCCYLDKDGNVAKQTFKIYIYQMGERIDVKDSGTITFHFADGSSESATFETVNRRSDVWQSGVRYIAEVESDIDIAKLKGKMLQKTVIDGYASPMELSTPAKRAKKLAKTIAKSEKLALSNALAAKANNEVYIEPFKWPTHVKKYLLEFYPEGTTFVGEKIDTIEVPARTLASLQFSMNLDMAKMSERLKVISEMQGETMKAAAKKEVATADSLFNEYDACLSRIDSIAARNKKCERNDYQNYQRVQVSYTLPDGSKGATDVMTRIGEENPSDLAMLFDLELSDCKAQLKKYKEYIEKIRLP